MSAIRFDVFGQLDIKQRLQIMQLPANKRRQLMGGIGREIKRQSIRNLRARHDVHGNPWEPRKRGPKRKLLRHMNRQIAPNFVTPGAVEVRFKGVVAKQQHDGYTKTMTAASAARESGNRAHYEEPATKKQAKALRDEGFKYRVKGSKKWRRPSLRWISQNMKQKQAGLVLKILRDEASKKSWVTTIPARPFLGMTETQINQAVNKIYDNTINSRV